MSQVKTYASIVAGHVSGARGTQLFIAPGLRAGHKRCQAQQADASQIRSQCHVLAAAVNVLEMQILAAGSEIFI